jgi:glutathione S-transferase
MPMMLLKLVFDRFAHPPMPLVMRPVAAVIAIGVKAKFVTPRLAQHLDFIEAELGKSTWFAGEELTGADIQMSFPLEAAAARGAVDDRPNILAFVERIHARPAYQEALRRGGPYDYA